MESRVKNLIIVSTTLLMMLGRKWIRKKVFGSNGDEVVERRKLRNAFSFPVLLEC
jgi:uncharacterized membrane protein